MNFKAAAIDRRFCFYGLQLPALLVSLRNVRTNSRPRASLALRDAAGVLWRRCIRFVLSPIARGVDVSLMESRPSRFGQIEIYRQQSFVDFVSEALQRLRSNCPYAYRLVERYVRAIVENHSDLEGILNGVRYDKQMPSGTPPLSTKRYAALLVRDAITQRFVSNLRDTKNVRTLLFAMKKELDVMRCLQCESQYFHPQQNRILRLERELSRVTSR
jgi:hypothetical protein